MPDRLFSDPRFDLPPVRKREAKVPRARLRILIAGDPARPMRTISLPRALPLVLSLIAGFLVVATVLLACGSWKMSDARSSLERRVRAMMQAAHSVALGTTMAATDSTPGWNAPPARAPSGEMGRFVLQGVNTHEELEIVLNLQTGEVDADSYRRLRHLMRCLHTTAETPIDPRLIDLLYRISQRTHQRVLLVSGFRAPMYSKATLSYHTRGMAADIRIPGMTALMARDLAESMGVRGLGYYPVSGFIHVDVRDNRTRWTDYGDDRQETETTEHGPDHGPEAHESAGPAATGTEASL